jgi:hypothetical protein
MRDAKRPAPLAPSGGFARQFRIFFLDPIQLIRSVRQI